MLSRIFVMSLAVAAVTMASGSPTGTVSPSA